MQILTNQTKEFSNLKKLKWTIIKNETVHRNTLQEGERNWSKIEISSDSNPNSFKINKTKLIIYQKISK